MNMHHEHRTESTFRYASCRFVLTCSCGAGHDTPYIDEALEWQELHRRLAPLADAMAASTHLAPQAFGS